MNHAELTNSMNVMNQTNLSHEAWNGIQNIAVNPQDYEADWKILC